MRFARGYGKFAAIAATPLQYASAGDSPPTTFTFFPAMVVVFSGDEIAGYI